MSEPTTPNLQLPTVWPAQAQKHVPVNEAFARLDALVQLSVRDRDLADPPASPDEGDRYIVAGSATGAWTGKSGQVAARIDGTWIFFPPKSGWTAWVEDEAGLVYWDGGAWAHLSFASAANAALFGINTSADATNRLAVKSDAALFSHDDVTPGSGDIRVKLDKEAPAATASVVFQTGFSGRAEFGLAGDDDFRVKVSPDGSAWHEAMVVDRSTGEVRFPSGSDGLPVGTVIWHAASTAPNGFLKADGAAVSRATYARLFAAIGTTYGAGNGATTFNLPDLRGEFVRGLDDGRGVDTGRAIGSAQSDAFQGHIHQSPPGAVSVGTPYQAAAIGPSAIGVVPLANAAISDGSNGAPRTASETRPRNLALLACIKV
ncbi:DUF2793 domain-containing protein [Amorphus orientalis]|uniref:Microcystin-dependent protein n=1 Tax=Amorphus orientalis TaxID=649198 RepID=A0AAE3VTC9_9HYPH|nr:DUF2793 domain-containing protein [Amorphus orientalis]MDQ0317825.1 microcystin-dependent protein [Amorphus orientalis]